MQTLRSCVVLVVLVVLPVVAGCGGAAAPGTSASVGAPTTPAPASQPPDGGDDDGGAVSIPPIVAATYTKGAFHADVSGDITATMDLQFRDGFSAEGSTFVNYGELGGDQATILMSPDLIGLSASVGTVSIAGSTVDANHCDAVITQSDATRLAGTFDCNDLLSFDSATGTNIGVDMRGTFEASP